jgi:PAS domain-containing protein
VIALSPEAWIALAALLVSFAFGLHSILTSQRLTRLQELVAEADLRVRREEEEWSRRARLRVRLEKAPDQIVLWNDGGSDAMNIRLQVRSRGSVKDPIERDARRKLPLPRLRPDDPAIFSAFVLWEHGPVFDVEIRWQDPDGSEQCEEVTLYA